MFDDTVGYGNPPKKSQFAKGKSGNPKGRPKGSKNLAQLVHAIATETIVVTKNGKRHKAQKREALLQDTFNRALTGDHRARTSILNLLATIEAQNSGAVAKASPFAEADREVLAKLEARLATLNEPTPTDGDEDV